MAEPICPECRQGKCQNCNGEAWDDARDQPAPCVCTHGAAPAAEIGEVVTVRYRSPGGRWLTVTGEVVAPERVCICAQTTSRLLHCPVHPERTSPPGVETQP